MAVHPTITDLDQIKQQRIKEIREVRAARRRDTWPTPCATCLAGVGEPCMTINGKRAMRHNERK